MQFQYNRKDLVYYSLTLAIFVAGFFLRFYHLSSYPLQVNQDELSNIYDGYSIAETGADRWGDKYPLTLRGFGNGDHRPSMYAWLCAGTIKLFGPTIWAGRLPSAVLGFLSLVLIFLTAHKIGGRTFALLSLLLATLMPWHIIYSRMAHEGTILPGFFLILGVFLWLKAKETGYSLKYLVLLGLSTGLGVHTCHAGKLIFFSFAILIFTELYFSKAVSFKKAGILALSLLTGALPQLLPLLLNTDTFFSRASNTILPYSFTYGYINNLFDSLYSNFSSHYLFFSFGEYNKHTVGRLLNIECLFFYTGLFFFYRQFKRDGKFNPGYLYALVFIAVFPASLTNDNPHAIRAASLTMFLSFFSAAGIIFIYERIERPILRKIFLAASVFLILVNGVYLIQKYPGYAPNIAARHQNGLVELASRVNMVSDKYSRVLIEDVGNQPYIYFAYYCNITPRRFKSATKQYQENAWEGGWDHFTRLEKYHFLTPEQISQEINNPGNNTVLFITPKTDNRYHISDSVLIEDKKYFFISMSF